MLYTVILYMYTVIVYMYTVIVYNVIYTVKVYMYTVIVYMYTYFLQRTPTTCSSALIYAGLTHHASLVACYYVTGVLCVFMDVYVFLHAIMLNHMFYLCLYDVHT